MFKVIFLLAIIAFVCEGVMMHEEADARRGKIQQSIAKLKSGTQRFKHKLKSGIHKDFKIEEWHPRVGRHFTLRYIIPDYKEADWGEMRRRQTEKENPCVTECKRHFNKYKCHKSFKALLKTALEGYKKPPGKGSIIERMFLNDEFTDEDLHRALAVFLSFGREKKMKEEHKTWTKRVDKMVETVTSEDDAYHSCSQFRRFKKSLNEDFIPNLIQLIYDFNQSPSDY